MPPARKQDDDVFKLRPAGEAARPTQGAPGTRASCIVRGAAGGERAGVMGGWSQGRSQDGPGRSAEKRRAEAETGVGAAGSGRGQV